MSRKDQSRKPRRWLWPVVVIAIVSLVAVLVVTEIVGLGHRTVVLSRVEHPAEGRAQRGAVLVLEVQRPGLIRRLLVNPPADRHGRRPQDVVVAFFEDVAKGDRVDARRWWHDHPDPHRVAHPRGFDALFDELRTVDRVVLEPTGKGKAAYYNVRIHTFRNGRQTDFNPYLTLERNGDEWKILRSLLW